MEIKMTDVMLHIDELLDNPGRDALESKMRNHQGVIGLGYPPDKPHLMIVEYNPDDTTPAELLNMVTRQGLHAVLIGL